MGWSQAASRSWRRVAHREVYDQAHAVAVHAEVGAIGSEHLEGSRAQVAHEQKRARGTRGRLQHHRIDGVVLLDHVVERGGMLAKEQVVEDLRLFEGMPAEDLPRADVDLVVVGRSFDDGSELMGVLLEVGDAGHERELAHVGEVQVERRAAVTSRRRDATNGDALEAVRVDDALSRLNEGCDDGSAFLIGVLGTAHAVLLTIDEHRL